MVKVFYLLKRRADLTPEQFHRYWREQHAPLFCKMEIARRYVVRYEQNHAPPQDVELFGGHFDGASVMWLRSVEDLVAMRADPEYGEIVRDGQNFLDPTATKLLLTEAEEPFEILK